MSPDNPRLRFLAFFARIGALRAWPPIGRCRHYQGTAGSDGRVYLDEHCRLRDRVLFDLASDSKLRGRDLVKMRIGDVMSGKDLRKRATVRDLHFPLPYHERRAGLKEPKRATGWSLWKRCLAGMCVLISHSNSCSRSHAASFTGSLIRMWR